MSNTLESAFPEVAAEWDYELNGELTPDKVTPRSNRKAWWKCKKGHSWEAVIANRTYGKGCPFCAGKRLVAGENDLATVAPELAAQWDYERNRLSPDQVFSKSSGKFWWICEKGHRWGATVSNRRKSKGCPYCNKDHLVEGEYNLELVYPEIAKEWDYERNNCTPDMVFPKSNKKFWWKCEEGHTWNASPNSRASGSGCPVCNRRRINPGINDLLTLRPDIAAEWDEELNGPLPNRIGRYSNEKVWWKCANGHPSWKTTSRARMNGTRCPYCVGKRHIPGETDLATLRPDLAEEWVYEMNGTLKPEDVSRQSGRKVWWKCRYGHPAWQAAVCSREKGHGCPYCASQKALPGINDLGTLHPEIRIEWDVEMNGGKYPENISAYSNRKYWWKCAKGHPSWFATVYSRSRGHGCPYCAGKRPIPGETDLATARPDLLMEWNYEKNKDISPEEVCINSMKHIWWKCSNGHEWKAKIGNRAIGHGCPYCSGRKAILGETDLATLRPDIAAEWDYDANGDLRPEMFTAFSHKRVSWKCADGHPSWQAVIHTRGLGAGCPYCAGHLPIEGVNDFETLHPELAKEWDYEENGALLPSMVTEHSRKKVSWICSKCNNKWKTKVSSRTHGYGCPYCAGYLPMEGINDFETLYPELAKEWDYEENESLLPSMVTERSHRKVSWKCSKCNNTWIARIFSRTKGCGCPYCAGQLPMAGINDFETLHPDLAKEWDYEENGDLLPSMVTERSSRKVNWKCSKCHVQWRTRIFSRAEGNGCPYCSGKRKITYKDNSLI